MIPQSNIFKWVGIASSIVVVTFLSTLTFAQSALPPPLEKPVFDAVDQPKEVISIKLIPVATSLSYLTDVAFPPADYPWFIALEKNGLAKRVNYHIQDGILQADNQAVLFERDVFTISEQGLLGLAFHPKYSENGLIFIHYSTNNRSKRVGRIEKIKVDNPAEPQKIIEATTILEVVQPYVNHNGGQLAFGPDGYLYIGFGDGGAANDLHGYAQNTKTFLGKMLRIDIDKTQYRRNYTVPADNPFVNHDEILSEIWNIGLRNPWRFSFTPSGDLIIADVGQNAWEEIDIARKGDNLGWNIKEGRHCFEENPLCATEVFVEPIYEYSHAEGQSVIGGYIASAKSYHQLKGKYVFGDYVSGRLWALSLPTETNDKTTVYALGKWPIAPASFAIDRLGNVFVSDHKTQTLYQIVE